MPRPSPNRWPRTLFLSGERSLARKLQEALYAWRLERALGKHRILEIYLNIAEWGPGLFGIRDASRHYFDVEPADLDAQQAAFLALLLPSPVRYHGWYHHRSVETPALRENLELTLERMYYFGYVGPEAFGALRGRELTFAPCGLR